MNHIITDVENVDLLGDFDQGARTSLKGPMRGSRRAGRSSSGASQTDFGKLAGIGSAVDE
jgi:hypothetical protein